MDTCDACDPRWSIHRREDLAMRCRIETPHNPSFGAVIEADGAEAIFRQRRRRLRA